MTKVINSNVLKILAVLLMVIDHVGGAIFTGNQVLRMIGRLSFPIFAFLIAEGAANTSNLSRYKKRLFIFAILSEIPYDLVFYNKVFFLYAQNIMFTLLLGVLCINEMEKLKNNYEVKVTVVSTLKILFYCVISVIGFADYNIYGVLTIMMFYIFRNIKFGWIGQVLGLFLLYVVYYHTNNVLALNVLGLDLIFPVQGLCILALPLIWLYNGKRGNKNKILQYGFYAFYPVHLLVLWLIRCTM